jgi:hypothetical protein
LPPGECCYTPLITVQELSAVDETYKKAIIAFALRFLISNLDEDVEESLSESLAEQGCTNEHPTEDEIEAIIKSL